MLQWNRKIQLVIFLISTLIAPTITQSQRTYTWEEACRLQGKSDGPCAPNGTAVGEQPKLAGPDEFERLLHLRVGMQAATNTANYWVTPFGLDEITELWVMFYQIIGDEGKLLFRKKFEYLADNDSVNGNFQIINTQESTQRIIACMDFQARGTINSVARFLAVEIGQWPPQDAKRFRKSRSETDANNRLCMDIQALIRSIKN